MFLLTMGEHPESLAAPTYPLYKDPRCATQNASFHSMPALENAPTPRTWGVENGIGAALISGLDGLAVLASTISTSTVETVKQHKLVDICSLVSPLDYPSLMQKLIAWTDNNEDEETVARLKRVGVDGVIVDRIEQALQVIGQD